MEPFEDRLARVRDSIAAACRRVGNDPGEIRIVAITKGHPAAVIAEATAASLTDIGENRVQEAISKFATAAGALSRSGVRRHMVGHLQRNKIRDAVEIFDWVQSIDSVRLARALSQRMAGRTERMQVLIEVNAGMEGQKQGFALEAAIEGGLEITELPGLAVRGVMSMAPWTDDEAVLRRSFGAARRVFEELRAERPGQVNLDTLSMGMSNDYGVAIEEGATMVRLGTALFGVRSGR